MHVNTIDITLVVDYWKPTSQEADKLEFDCKGGIFLMTTLM